MGLNQDKVQLSQWLDPLMLLCHLVPREKKKLCKISASISVKAVAALARLLSIGSSFQQLLSIRVTYIVPKG